MEVLATSMASELIQAKPRPLFFEHEVTVTFCDTNAEGNVGHNIYARLFGETRELFGLEYIPGFAQGAGREYLLKTRSASYEFKRDFVFGDQMVVRMRVTEVRGASFVLAADFVHKESGQVYATGQQLIAYADMSGRPQRMPKELRELLHLIAEGKTSEIAFFLAAAKAAV